jgi:hypothetical protein
LLIELDSVEKAARAHFLSPAQITAYKYPIRTKPATRTSASKSRRAGHDDRAASAIAAVREVYAELTARPVQRNCTRLTECCQFRLTGRTPWLTDAEAMLAAKAWRSTGRTRLPEKPDGSCPMLEDRTGRCLIYADRPFACRTHFCEAAGGPYDRRDVLDLIRRLETASAGIGGTGPLPIQSALMKQM